VVAAAAAALSVVVGSAPAQASLVGATVQTASYLDVPFPPPAASPTECTIIDCNILDYQGPSGPTNSPLPIVPVTYVEDSLTLTTVSVGDTQITITNDFAGLFCPSRGCTPGDFSGYVFTFTGAPDITNVEVGSGSSLDFQPVAPPTGGVTPGLTWTTNSITVNVAGDNLAVGDQLILDVTSGSFSFTRTVSGNWTDATGWTPNGVPNGATVTAQLVNPASGTNNVNLGGGTFTVNQLQFSGTNAGTWDVTNGTIVFDGTNPTFLNQGDSSGLAGTLPNLTLNATTTFEIDNASALTDVIGDITGAGGLIKTGAGTLTLTGANTYAGGTTISAGTLQIGNGGTTGSIVGNVTDNAALAFDRSDGVTFGGVISGTGSLTQLGAGTLTLTGANTYTGGTTISAGTLQIGNGGTAGSIVGNVLDNGVLAFDRSDNVTFGGVISGTGSLSQLGAGTLILTGANTYGGATTIAAGTLALAGAGSIASSSGVADNGTFDISGTTSGASIATLSGSGGVTLGSKTLTLTNQSSTFAGVIGGAGGLTLTGAGTETLTGTNTYTGGTTIGAGTLQIGNGGTTGSIAGNVADNGALTFDRSDNVSYGGVVSGTGSLTQLGAGTLTLTGVNTYTGNTAIGSGSTLQIGGAGSLGSGSYAGNITDNGTFEYSSSAAQTLSGVISGAGALAQNGTGTLILTGVNTYAGGTFLDAGTLGIDSNGDLGAGPLVMQPGTTLRFEASGLNLPNTIVLRNADPTIDTGANTDTISGVISGPGSLAKIGSGTLILSAANTYAGATDVQAGTLAVTGSIVSSATVESGATLGGSGTIGGLVAKSAATIAPGVLAPFSTLTVNGAASFAAGSIFAVNVNAAGQNDKLVTTGSTTIAGGTVQVTPVPGTYAPQTRYTLITAGGGVSGTFSALTGLSSLAFLTPALSYDPDDVFLGFTEKTVTTPPTTPTPPLLFPSVAQTPNQIATATALSAQPMGSPLFNAVIGQTVPGALAAFDALSGEVHASAVSAAFDDQRLPREAVFDRLATPYGAALAGGAQSVQTLAAPNPAQVFAAWGQAFDSWGHIGGDGNAATLSNNLGGLIFGADATLQGRYRLGVAGGYDYSTLGLGARGSSGNVSTTYVGLYGGLSDGALQLRGGGFYGYNHYGTNRTAVFPGFADTLGSGYGGDTWQAFAEAGWRTPVGGLAAYSAWAEPFVGLTGLEIATRSFGESAGAAALNGASAAYDFGITTLGLRGEASLFAWAPLVANGMIGWQRAFGDVTPNSVLAFASAPDVPFAIAGAPIARNALAVEAGADWRFTANVKIGIYYSGLIASNASDNAIKVKLEANF
jgi:fibronectin-binding autotransporter adhesin